MLNGSLVSLLNLRIMVQWPLLEYFSYFLHWKLIKIPNVSESVEMRLSDGRPLQQQASFF